MFELLYFTYSRSRTSMDRGGNMQETSEHITMPCCLLTIVLGLLGVERLCCGQTSSMVLLQDCENRRSNCKSSRYRGPLVSDSPGNCMFAFASVLFSLARVAGDQVHRCFELKHGPDALECCGCGQLRWAIVCSGCAFSHSCS